MLYLICSLLSLTLATLLLIYQKQRQFNQTIAELTNRLYQQSLSIDTMLCQNPTITNYRNTAQDLFKTLCNRGLQTETDAIIILWHAQIAVTISKYQTAQAYELYSSLRQHIESYDQKRTWLPHNIVYCYELCQNIQSVHDNFQKQLTLMQMLCDMHELSLVNVISYYESILQASEN